MKPILTFLLANAFFNVLLQADSSSSDALAYKSGYSNIMKLGKDVYCFLAPKEKELISPQPISLVTDPIPFARVFYVEDEPKPIRGVMISEGFIDLVNHIAHAKAIDSIEKGYFEK